MPAVFVFWPQSDFVYKHAVRFTHGGNGFTLSVTGYARVVPQYFPTYFHLSIFACFFFLLPTNPVPPLIFFLFVLE